MKTCWLPAPHGLFHSRTFRPNPTAISDPRLLILTHWTGSKNRLDRDFGGHRFGSEGHAVEELVAELGAAFLCADLELALEPREDHAAYIASWLKVLAADNRAVFTAAAHAQRATEFIHRAASGPATEVNATSAA